MMEVIIKVDTLTQAMQLMDFFHIRYRESHFKEGDEFESRLLRFGNSKYKTEDQFGWCTAIERGYEYYAVRYPNHPIYEYEQFCFLFGLQSVGGDTSVS